jgi:hypothetical protein
VTNSVAGSVLSKIFVLAEERRIEIQLIHRQEKPYASKKSIRKGQPTIPKALAMSTFRKMHENFHTCSNLAVDWTVLKLLS